MTHPLKYLASLPQIEAAIECETMKEAVAFLWGLSKRRQPESNKYRSLQKWIKFYNREQPARWNSPHGKGRPYSAKHQVYAVRSFLNTPAGEVEQAKRDSSIQQFWGTAGK